MRGILAALQLFAAFFLTIFGIGVIFTPGNPGGVVFGSGSAGLGLTFLTLLAINLKMRS